MKLTYRREEAREEVEWQMKVLKKMAKNPGETFKDLYCWLAEYCLLLYSFIECKKKKKKVAPGLDNKSYDDIEKSGLDSFIKNTIILFEEKKYKPDFYERRYINKGAGKYRPINIPTTRDRVVQRAMVTLLNPIIEPTLLGCSFAYRPGIGVNEAIEYVIEKILKGNTSIFKADITGCFENLDRKVILDSLNEKIKCKNFTDLVSQFLSNPVINNGKRIITSQGIHQGDIISPLLSNLGLHTLDCYWQNNLQSKYQAEYVRYADDFLLMTRYENKKMIDEIKKCLKTLGLELNEHKSKQLNLRSGQALPYLGYVLKLNRVSPMELIIEPNGRKIDAIKHKLIVIYDKAFNCQIGYYELLDQVDFLIKSFKSSYKHCNNPKIFNDISEYNNKLYDDYYEKSIWRR